MFRLKLRAVFLVLLLLGSLTASEAVAQTDALPAIGVDGVVAPLTVDQLDVRERLRFTELPSGSEAARQFLHTRGYLRYGRLVVAGKLAPVALPNLPAVADWNREFLNEEERGIVDTALEMKILASLQDKLPAFVAAGEVGPLTVDQLDEQERGRFMELAPGSDAARQFLYTRGYLRYCRQVVAGKLAPLDLPMLPVAENWNRAFLSEEEASNFVDVALGMKLMALISK